MLIDRLPTPPPGQVWAGDDGAVVDLPPGRVVVAVDGVHEGVDFDTAYASASDVGWRAVAVNVSDMAAMAASPCYAVALLNMPPGLPQSWFEGFLEGVSAAADRFRVPLVGGDLGSSPHISASVTMIGVSDRPVLRTGARPGDLICVTGSLGGSAGGLEALQGGGLRSVPKELLARHLRPEPRLEEGLLLGLNGATAMIDVSDGFALDLLRLMRASGAGCEVDPAKVPVDSGLQGSGSRELALFGGDDYELLVTLPRERWETVRDLIRPGLTVLGEVTEGPRRLGNIDLDEAEGLGWDHLRKR